MKNPQNILVPTDFSESAAAAAQYAVNLAGGLGAKVHLVHALPTPITLPVGLMHVPSILAPGAEDDTVRDRAATELATFHRKLDIPSGVEVTTSLWPGPTKATLAARAGDYDLVVMGTHGRTGLVRLALGSVAEHLVRTCPVPVLTVRDGAGQKAPAEVRTTGGTTVGEVMTKNPITLSPKVRVRGAAELAERLKFCHILVEDPGDGSLLGVACTCQLCKAGGDRTLGEVMSSPAITVVPETTLVQAAEIMKEKEIGALPVLEGGDLVGVITTTDLQSRGLAEGLGLATGVCDSCGGQIHVRLHSAESAAEFCNDCMQHAEVVEGHDMIGVGD